jgi:hypothetical protein
MENEKEDLVDLELDHELEDAPRVYPDFKTVNDNMYVTEIVPEVRWTFPYPDEDTQRLIQEVLASKKLYPGKQNGVWGALTVSVLQKLVAPLDETNWVSRRVAGVPDQELVDLIKDYTDAHAGVAPDGAKVDLWLDFLDALESSAS